MEGVFPLESLAFLVMNLAGDPGALAGEAAKLTGGDLAVDRARLEAVRYDASFAERRARRSVDQLNQGLRRFGDGYRALARLPDPSRAPVPTAPLLADLQRLLLTRWPAVPFALEAAAAPAMMEADADQLWAALWALSQNAAEALDGNTEPKVLLRAQGGAEAVIFDVIDNGPGLPPCDANRVLQPFVTTKPASSGVGLPLARQIVRAHGGHLTIEPMEGLTCFRINLPHDQTRVSTVHNW